MFSGLKDLLSSDPIESMSRPLLAERFEEIRSLKGAIAVYEARLITATNRLGDEGIDGAAMMRVAGRTSNRVASAAARRAESLERLPQTRDALASGRITAEHADSIVAAAGKVSPEKADGDLVGRAGAAPADVFGKEAREWTTKNRDDDGRAELATQRRNRSGRKWIRRDNDMYAFYFELDRVDGQAVHASIDKRYDELWRDDGGRDANPDEIRTPDQRMADALVSLVAGRVATTADGVSKVGRPSHPKHHLSVVYDISGHDHQGRPLASLVTDGEPLPAPVLERIACNANITPMVFNGPARPVWVGRTLRNTTPAQWQALIVRDKGCVGCAAAPSRCEAHHLVPWTEGGSTDIDNLVLVCSRCHHDLHDRGMTLERTNGQWHIDSRDGPDPNPPPDQQLILTA